MHGHGAGFRGVHGIGARFVGVQGHGRRLGRVMVVVCGVGLEAGAVSSPPR